MLTDVLCPAGTTVQLLPTLIVFQAAGQRRISHFIVGHSVLCHLTTIGLLCPGDLGEILPYWSLTEVVSQQLCSVKVIMLPLSFLSLHKNQIDKNILLPHLLGAPEDAERRTSSEAAWIAWLSFFILGVKWGWSLDFPFGHTGLLCLWGLTEEKVLKMKAISARVFVHKSSSSSCARPPLHALTQRQLSPNSM